MFAELGQTPAWEEKIAPPIARDKAHHGRVIFFTETHDHVFDRRHALAVVVEDRTTQHLREIEHEKDSPRRSNALAGMIIR
jgi:hypothetical protein